VPATDAAAANDQNPLHRKAPSFRHGAEDSIPA
jgi:hypothetical protein